ncbi:hypothetical protein SAMN05443245_7290 [Paraburkholderia fungorum]|uniref:DUF35 domain-containing protein n=1 Tax=Paraburkholderia fungorum TaxID=134537 RepID=A0A1H1JUW7_9BURK|nr:OB-fold domain-containing protein [Paraburkholderia fungorum]SDR53861.1 hypothetical protein SAMN05443245_7290 [Paraburkholderia fungorum]
MKDKIMPVMDANSEPYWKAARDRRLLIQRCARTGLFQWYPRQHCIHDTTFVPQWVEASGFGVVFSYSVIFRGGFENEPYICALVELQEGVLMLSRLEGIAPERVRIGLDVAVDFLRIDDTVTLPIFKPRDKP